MLVLLKPDGVALGSPRPTPPFGRCRLPRLACVFGTWFQRPENAGPDVAGRTALSTPIAEEA